MSDDGGQVLRRRILILGLVLVVAVVGVWGYLVFTGDSDAEGPIGGGPSETPVVPLGLAALMASVLLAVAAVALVAKTVRRPGRHRTYGAYFDSDDDDGW
jgi:hypothetical protein